MCPLDCRLFAFPLLPLISISVNVCRCYEEEESVCVGCIEESLLVIVLQECLPLEQHLD